MVANDVNRISANFAEVEAGAQQIIAEGKKIKADLDELYQKVNSFVTSNGGATIDAFKELQAKWAQHSEQLNTTLNAAGQLVSSGNAELQGKDTALAGLF